MEHNIVYKIIYILKYINNYNIILLDNKYQTTMTKLFFVPVVILT